MKRLISLLVGIASFLLLSLNATSQSHASELFIANSTVSAHFEGIQIVAECTSNGIVGQFEFFQPSGTNLPHYYDNIPGHYSYYAEICDQFGNCVTIGDASSSYPQIAYFPTGDKAIWHYYGCNHNSVIEISH